MEKNAQKRSVLNQLREKINMPGSYLEGFFRPELDRVMTSLKDLDDKIRSVLTGKKIGTSDAPDDGTSTKDLLKSARTNFNRREYMAGVADLGRFHKKMFDVTQDISKFFVDVNKIHHKFLFEGLPENYQDNLKSLREHMDSLQRKASLEYIVKTAGIMDFFYNIGTKRGRSLAAWEKKYPKQTKDLREGGDRLINEAQKLLDNAIAYLKQMASARALRRPDEYIDIANKIKADFDKFDSGNKGFREYYNKAIVPWLAIKDEIDAKENAQDAGKDEPPIKDTSSVPATPSATVAPPAAPVTTTPVAPLAQSPIAAPPGVPSPEQMQSPEGHITAKSPPPSGMPVQKKMSGHNKFLQSLESLSNEDPLILSGYIAKYAFLIQESDPETAIKLFTVSRKIKG